MKHLLEQVSRSLDPEGRSEAFAYCGVSEECSGSGRHGMLLYPKDGTCARCVELWTRELTEELDRLR